MNRAFMKDKTGLDTDLPGKVESKGEQLEFVGMPEENYESNKSIPNAIYQKYGNAVHKAWLKKAEFECAHCGCTLNRKGDFCPHCGTSLDYAGVD